MANGKDVQAVDYQPTVSQAKNFPEIFEGIGLRIDNSWIKISEFKTSASNYVIDEKIFYKWTN